MAPRRYGSETSKTRSALLDAAEGLMLAEGYASVSSRRVAAEAGVKPALVHYYFHTMDDLFLALHRRRSESRLQLQERILTSDQPLWGFWDFCRDPQGTALTMELVALGNHRKVIRAEMTASAARFRAEQLKALTKILKGYGVEADQCPPIVAAILISSISRFLVLEEEGLELFTGHAETVAFIERFIRKLEGERRSASQEVSPTQGYGLE